MGNNPIAPPAPPISEWSDATLEHAIAKNRGACRWYGRPNRSRRALAHQACLILIRRRRADLGLFAEPIPEYELLPGPVDVTAPQPPPKRADARQAAVPPEHLGHGSYVVQEKRHKGAPERCSSCGVVVGRRHAPGCTTREALFEAVDRIDVRPELR